MSDFWWQVQQQEEQEWQELCKRDPEYAKWLNKLNGCENIKRPTTNSTTQEKQRWT